MAANRVITVLLTHQEPAMVRAMVDYWREHQHPLAPVIAYGGSGRHFEEVGALVTPSVFIDDPRLHTVDHPRERQSYLGVMKGVVEFLGETSYDFVHVVEYDEVPVVADVQAALVKRMGEERADVLACGLKRVDETSDPHWLNHVSDPDFGRFWSKISRRDEAQTVLSALGCGMFWTASAFRDVAGLREEVPIYLEIFLPTAAHHLGYRVRPLSGQYKFMHPNNRFGREDLARLRSEGALCAHPLKEIWGGGWVPPQIVRGK